MISLPDFKHKQILFIQNDFDSRYYMKLQAEHLVYYKDDKITNKISTHKLFAIFLSGPSTISTNLIKELVSRGSSIYFLSSNFSVYAEISAHTDGHFVLRSLQYHSSTKQDLKIAQHLVYAKIRNQLYLVKSYFSDDSYINQKRKWKNAIEKVKDSQSLLAIEGQMAKLFFSLYFKEVGWTRRIPQVKPDIVNFLMDMGYTFLFNMVDALLQLHGFDTYKGVYHTLFFARKSLACDLMEPFRCIVDRAILKAFRLKQINSSDFDFSTPNISLNYKKRTVYAKILTTEILSHKEQIFKYIKGYYLHILKPDVYSFPTFYIR